MKRAGATRPSVSGCSWNERRPPCLLPPPARLPAARHLARRNLVPVGGGASSVACPPLAEVRQYPHPHRARQAARTARAINAGNQLGNGNTLLSCHLLERLPKRRLE